MSYYNLFWLHPYGDHDQAPCLHQVLQHPGGHTEMAPCGHPGTQHGNDAAYVPCTHIPHHKGGHTQDVPCIHPAPAHPGGHQVNVPCTHLGPEHPEGHRVEGPCAHGVPIVRRELDLHLFFHTNSRDVQDTVIGAVRTLKEKLHIRAIGNPLRPLHVFSRDWEPGPHDSSNEAWSCYKREVHALQISPDDRSNKDAIHHEFGHALAGTQLPWFRKWSTEDAHFMKRSSDPGVAMSEGWAHFVALAIQHAQGASVPTYQGQTDWENRDPSVKKVNDIEYNIACLLWDLYDEDNDFETASFSFKELFSVLSPRLEALDSGPVITGIDDYLDRLRRAFPGKVEVINRVRDIHLSSKNVGGSGLVGGSGGAEFKDDVEGTSGISKITVRAGSLIDAIQVDYRVSGGIRNGPRRGGAGGTETSCTLAPGEWIASMEGQHNGSIIRQLTFHISRSQPNGTVSTRTWSAGQPGPLWVTANTPAGGAVKVDVVPGTWISILGVPVFVPPETVCGSTLNVPLQGGLVVEGENAFKIDCEGMKGFYGRCGSLLDAIGVMYE